MSTITRYRAQLDLGELDDPERHAAAGGIAKLAPSSALYAASPSIQASVAALAKKDAALAQSNAAVVNDRKQLTADTDVETTARSTFDAELSNLATLTGNGAQSAADISAMGLKPLVRAPRATGAPAVPTGIDVKYPVRGHGKATASVQQPKGMRWEYVVQTTANPITGTSWELLVGNGKTRALTGASGTQAWVRAARVRAGVQSDFCTPVLVTIP